MAYNFNPFTGNLDEAGAAPVAEPAGDDTQIQFNDNGVLAGSPDLGWDDTEKILDVGGDINLDDGGTYATTLQLVTPTANRTISFPNATGTVGLVAGSSGQVVYNNAGAYAGLSTVTTDGTNVTLTGRFISSLNGAASAPPGTFTGTWFTGGTSTTTKPQVLIEPTGATSTAWSTSGTGLGVNAASGFSGRLLDLQVNGGSRFNVGVYSATLATDNGNVAGTDGLFFTNSVFTQRHGIGTRYSSSSAGIILWGLGIAHAGVANDGFFVANQIGFCASTTASQNPDTFITRLSSGELKLSSTVQLGSGGFAVGESTDTLAQRRTTNAQTFRVYGTFTDASNFVRAALSSTSTAVTLAAQTAGTGADNIPLNLTAAGTGTIKVNSVAEVVVSSTVAGLPAAPVVGMLTRVTDALAPAVGSTVAGGGAAAALCWYNGANWSVIGV